MFLMVSSKSPEKKMHFSQVENRNELFELINTLEIAISKSQEKIKKLRKALHHLVTNEAIFECYGFNKIPNLRV